MPVSFALSMYAVLAIVFIGLTISATKEGYVFWGIVSLVAATMWGWGFTDTLMGVLA